jgi:Glycine zipper
MDMSNRLNRKPLIVAALAATVAVATLSTQANANDPLLGALVGAGIGAAIGHNVHGRDGAVVGGAIGALAGASIAAGSDRYYDARFQAVPAYYGDSYYQTAPVYYGGPSFVYAPLRVSYVSYRWPHYVDHGRQNDLGRRDRHDDNGRRGR